MKIIVFHIWGFVSPCKIQDNNDAIVASSGLITLDGFGTLWVIAGACIEISCGH